MDSRTARIVAEGYEAEERALRYLGKYGDSPGMNARADRMEDHAVVYTRIADRLEREEAKAKVSVSGWSILDSEGDGLKFVYIDKASAEKECAHANIHGCYKPYRVVPVLVTPVKED